MTRRRVIATNRYTLRLSAGSFFLYPHLAIEYTYEANLAS